MTSLLEIFLGLATTFLLLYYYFTSTFDFWRKQGVVGPRPIPFFGNVANVMLKRDTLGRYVELMYNKYKNERMVGIFLGRAPALILRDTNLINDVLIKDFNTFADRAVVDQDKADPIKHNGLFFVESKKWRPVRTKVSAVFAANKLKEIYPRVLECGNHLEEYLMQTIPKEGKIIRCIDFIIKYTFNSLNACAFGNDIDSFFESNSESDKLYRIVDSYNHSQTYFLAVFKTTFPWLYNQLGFFFRRSDGIKKLTNFTKDMIRYRKEHNVRRNDFLKALIDMQENADKLAELVDVNDLFLTAQTFIMLVAGYETSSYITNYALLELALYPNTQDELRKEIRKEYARHNGNWTNENVKEMKYLDKVYKEVLRKHPVAEDLGRKALSSYTFTGTRVTIDKGTPIFISLRGIHYDPEFYPEPEVFNPERFEGDSAPKNSVFFPFGLGPRNCLGTVFAHYQVKIALIKILMNFKVEICEKTDSSSDVDLFSLITKPRTDIYLKLSRID